MLLIIHDFYFISKSDDFFFSILEFFFVGVDQFPDIDQQPLGWR